MASLTMTPLDGQRPNKRFRRCTTGDPPSPRTDLTRTRTTRSSSTSSYSHASRRHSSATTVCSNSLTHSSCSHSHSRTPSVSHSPTFASASASRSRSAAEARALVLDPAYTGAGPIQPRVYVDELGVAHDPDYRMFPAVPSSPRSCNGAGVRRGSVTSARGRVAGSVGGCGDSPFSGSPFAGYVDFEVHYSNSASHEVDSDEDEGMDMDEDEDADAESMIEWSRLHASARPLGYGEGKAAEKDDGYAEFAGMEWDEREWRREEAPSLDKHSPPTSAGTDVKQSTPSTTTVLVPSASSASLPRACPMATAKIRIKHKPHSKAGSVSSTTRGYVPAKRSYDESIRDEWAPSCGHSVRRHWQSFTLRIRLTVFRWRRRLRRAFAGTSGDQRA